MTTEERIRAALEAAREDAKAKLARIEAAIAELDAEPEEDEPRRRRRRVSPERRRAQVLDHLRAAGPGATFSAYELARSLRAGYAGVRRATEALAAEELVYGERDPRGVLIVSHRPTSYRAGEGVLRAA